MMRRRTTRTRTTTTTTMMMPRTAATQHCVTGVDREIMGLGIAVMTTRPG
jgi:hypothetical protein